MTSIRNFFPSSTTSTSLLTTPSPAKNEIKTIPIGRPDNKLIVSNMKSVINSLKMQKKSKKRKRNRDEPQEIHDISKILKCNLSFISPNRTNPDECKAETSKELNIIETSTELKSDDESVIASTETEYGLDNSKENNSIEGNTTITCSQPSRDEEKSQSTANAFEFMMTARNRSIGTNSTGKEISDKSTTTVTGREEIIVKRRLMLEEWAARKGGARKRLIEEANDKYIDVVMKKRTKRLKTLLQNGNKQKECKSSEEETVSQLVKQSNRKVITKRKKKIVDSEECDDNDDDSKDQYKSSTSSTIPSKEQVCTNKKIGRKTVSNENFVEKLSSPLKKRDSLFGYFSKLTKSPADDNDLQTIEDISPKIVSSKKRGRSRQTLTIAETKNGPPINDTRRQITPSPPPMSNPDSPKRLSEGRPKRLCRDKKISYFIDQEFGPPKSASAVKQSKSTKPTKPTKLAPIFAKAIPKPMIDPTVLRARQEFLQSGIPEKMKLEIEKQRQFEESYETEFEVFPKVSHVGHHVESNVMIDLDALNIRFRSETVEYDEEKFSFAQSKLMKIEKSKSMHQEKPSNEIVSSQKEVIRQMKYNDSLQFPYYRCFKQLKRQHSPHLPEEDDGDSSIELIVEKVASINGYLTFTEKYKPMTASEILINCKPLTELKKFLSSWQENEDGRHCPNSDDDFNSNSSSTFGKSSYNKAIVLTGPPGCGKTAFVYALANDMNFKVLEINAGAKRTGKKVLQKLQEATQSHHVNNNQCSQNDRLNLLKKTKSKSSQSDESEDSGSSQKLSLILIEDAEVVFEQDFGFVESINQLITTTKRPVILITNQINCAHLSRFISRNTISFHAPKAAMASKWLSTLSVVERCYVTEDMCQSLYHQNNFDFRKTLLELQFFIQGSVDTASRSNHKTNDKSDNDVKIVDYMNNPLYDLFHKDQNRLEMVVPFPVDFTKLINKTNDLKSKLMMSEENSKSLDSLSNSLEFLNMISTAQWLDRKTDCRDRVANHLSEEINHFLVERSIKTGLDWNSHSESTCDIDSTDSRHQLVSIVSNLNNHSTRSLNLDVEPCLRSICRSEFERSQRERRSTRFYHYLRNNGNTQSFGTKMFDDHCHILSTKE